MTKTLRRLGPVAAVLAMTLAAAACGGSDDTTTPGGTESPSSLARSLSTVPARSPRSARPRPTSSRRSSRASTSPSAPPAPAAASRSSARARPTSPTPPARSRTTARRTSLRGRGHQVHRVHRGQRRAHRRGEQGEHLGRVPDRGAAQEDLGARARRSTTGTRSTRSSRTSRSARTALRPRHRLRHVRLLHRGDQRQGEAEPHRLHRRPRTTTSSCRAWPAPRAAWATSASPTTRRTRTSSRRSRSTAAPAASRPASETAQDGTYKPLSRPLFIYVSNKSRRASRRSQDFVEFYVDQHRRDRQGGEVRSADRRAEDRRCSRASDDAQEGLTWPSRTDVVPAAGRSASLRRGRRRPGRARHRGPAGRRRARLGRDHGRHHRRAGRSRPSSSSARSASSSSSPARVDADVRATSTTACCRWWSARSVVTADRGRRSRSRSGLGSAIYLAEYASDRHPQRRSSRSWRSSPASPPWSTGSSRCSRSTRSCSDFWPGSGAAGVPEPAGGRHRRWAS